ncbi:MAG: redoxin family protein [Nanoarchaeota archaeon]|nr:redoxin family protein [Nanoarchaeota archaeon]
MATEKKSNKILIYAVVIIVLAIVVFFFAGGKSFINIGGSSGGSGSASAPGETREWMNFELTDVATGEIFKISDFAGKPILLESFAVWCPTCTKQQKEIKGLHDEVGDSVISISLDTDPSEDEDRIRSHINANDFTWYYAISPIDMTQSLIDEFGVSIVSAPTAPMILICEDGSFRKLGGFGARSVDKLKSEIAKGC